MYVSSCSRFLLTGFSTHIDREVVKLLNFEIDTHVPPPRPSSLSFYSSCFFSDASSFIHGHSSLIPLPVRDDSKLPRHLPPSSYVFSDFQQTFYFDAQDLFGDDEDDDGYVFGTYKTVDRKVKPVPAVYPEDARVKRSFPEDPLTSLLPLPTCPPDFIPTSKLSQSRLDAMKINPSGFLWPEEEKLFTHMLKMNERGLAFDEADRGSFRSDYFSPYIIPVLPHEPWEYKNIPIPQAIKEDVVQLLREKIAAGLYEPSQSSYRSRWFCVKKKNGKIRIVHDLQPLNKVTIRDSGVPPILDDFVEPFAGRQCYTCFDLYSGFDARKLHTTSRDLTSFMTPLGLLRICSMPQGYTNSPVEFQNCTAFILQDEIPHVANVFIDDLPIKGPATRYEDEDGNPETIPDNPGIRRFIWEHAVDVHRIMHRFIHAGGTFAALKTQLCRPKAIILGQECNPEGRSPDMSKVEKILQWPIPMTPKDVRSFLGLCGTVRIWIKDYSKHARPLVNLYRKDNPFEWTEETQESFDYLKHAVSSAPALRPIDYTSPNPVILSVDTSKIAVGFILSQIDDDGKRRPARYGSLPMNERESNYSQPKLELYGLFRALRHYRLYLAGVKNLHVEVDAKYIKGMINHPDEVSNSTLNRWIQGILLFDFTIIHVPAIRHQGPDALSRRRPTPEELEEMEDDNDDYDWLDGMILFAHSHSPPYSATSLPSMSTMDISQDQVLRQITHFLRTMELPHFTSLSARKRFIKRSLQFFIRNDQLFKRRGPRPPVKVIFDPDLRLQILLQAHEQLGHRGTFGVFQSIRQRFYWPELFKDVAHHIRSCHECQIRSVRKAEVPLTVSISPNVFIKIYVDVMLMPKERGFRYLVAARDGLSLAAEGRALRNNTADSLARFFWEEIICRYGAIGEVVTDNGSEVKGAFRRLVQQYGIPHIRISPYNSKANGVVERGHFIIREAIIKSCEGNLNLWPTKVHHAFFADKVTTRRSTGFSPFYLLHATEPALPFDLTEATFLVDGFHSGMDPDELLALRIRQLEKRPDDLQRAMSTLHASRLRSKRHFEKIYAHRMIYDDFKPGELVLVRNVQVEKELDRKSKPRYLGPYEVVRRKSNSTSYVLKELDGTPMRQGVAAFRLIPYYQRNNPLPIPPSDDSSNSDNDSQHSDDDLDDS